MTRAATAPSPVIIAASDARLSGDLRLPEHPRGLVVFAHGSGSSRHSARNVFVAESLGRHGLGSLLMDLLTPSEDVIDRQTAQWRFDVDLLGRRVGDVIDWLAKEPGLAHLPLGLFGASTGAAAALIAAASHPGRVRAVVSRGGRPDLAGAALARVTAPTLLLVGGLDDTVLALNTAAKTRLRGEVALEVVPGATHLFEEPGALEIVAESAAAWFSQHLTSAQPAPRHRT